MKVPEILIVEDVDQIGNGTGNVFEAGALRQEDEIVTALHELGHAEQDGLQSTLKVGLTVVLGALVVVVVVEGAEELARTHDEFENVLQRFHDAQQVVALRFRRHLRLDELLHHFEQLLVGQRGAEVVPDVQIQHRLSHQFNH